LTGNFPYHQVLLSKKFRLKIDLLDVQIEAPVRSYADLVAFDALEVAAFLDEDERLLMAAEP
jgi:hypothetical protein